MGTLYEPNSNIDQLLSTPPSDADVTKFANDSAEQLEKLSMREKFTANVKQVGVWANEVDEAFNRVTNSFKAMDAKYGKDFPGFSDFKDEWVGYNEKWSTHLNTSRDVASATVSKLRRFDQIFLDMVQNIQSNDDREAVIGQLQEFIDEKEDRATEMSQGFLKLKRDIANFVEKLDDFIKTTGASLAEEAKTLTKAIKDLNNEISEWDAKIKAATIALAATGGCLLLLGAAVSGTVLAVYQSKRNAKADELSEKQKALAEVNRKQEALPHLQTAFDGLKPDITLICDKLVLFSEIWSAVRSQTVQFQEHLRGGMKATVNIRFKAEVRLARSLCPPLQEGLEKYATELENRKKK